MAYKKDTYTNQSPTQLTTQTNNVLIGPIDVKGYSSFCLEIQNCHSSVALIGLRLQGAFDTGETVGFTEAPLWKDITSNTVPNFPVTTLSSCDSIRTTAISTLTPWIRVIGGASATSVAKIRAYVGGVLSK